MDNINLFGLEHSENPKFIIVPVPWDATASYHKGTAHGPKAILEASPQVDLFDPDFGDPTPHGIRMLDESEQVRDWNNEAAVSGQVEQVNQLSQNLNDWLYQFTSNFLEDNSIIGVVGGEHSVPFGYIKAISEKHKDFGIFHFDAHFDLRKAYQGYTHSHASIMYNVMESGFAPSKLVQVGLRDYCSEEWEYAQTNKDIKFHTQSDISHRLFNGENWANVVNDIISPLPENVYLSIDIDGFDPTLCPGTGTPVPGGLSFDQFSEILRQIVSSGRNIIGFDLVEVAPQDGDREWNGNVGMRVLYKMIAATARSQRL